MKRTSHAPVETDFVVIDEVDLVTVHTIQHHHVMALWQRAEKEGQANISRLCFAATNETNTPDLRRHALTLLAEHWNDAIEQRADLTIVTPPSGTSAAGTPTNFPSIPSVPSIPDRGHAPPADPTRHDLPADPTRHDPMVLMPVTFPCPFCHTGVVLVEHEGVLRLPYHRTSGIFPFSLAGPVYSVDCPGWWRPVYPICSGAHDDPACDDPICWRRTPDTEPAAEPVQPEVLPDPLPPASHITGHTHTKTWRTHEHTAQGYTLQDLREPARSSRHPKKP